MLDLGAILNAAKAAADPKNGLIQEQFMQALALAAAQAKSECRFVSVDNVQQAAEKVTELTRVKHLVLGQPAYACGQWFVFYFERVS